MILVCVNTFGNFEPGDEVLVPDDAVYDTAFFAAKGDSTPKGEDETPTGDESADNKEND